jgi:hypothetical protein
MPSTGERDEHDHDENQQPRHALNATRNEVMDQKRRQDEHEKND